MRALAMTPTPAVKVEPMNATLRRWSGSVLKALAAAAVLFAASSAALADKVTYYHNDLLGSPMAATDAAGQVLWRETWLPYGERLQGEEASLSNKIRYTSRHQDDDTGLVYMGARYYDPLVGRFQSVDAEGFKESNVHSFNRYAYANNNPYRYNDPDGRSAEELFPSNAPIVALGRFAGAAAAWMHGAASRDESLRVSGSEGMAENRHGAVEAVFAIGSVGRSSVQANKMAGDSFELQVMRQIQETQSGVVQQVTVKTQGGVKTRIDLMGRDASGKVVCIECKSSATAPLTKNQAKAFPEIQQSGAVVVGNGKPGFPGGTRIPPTSVDIVRP
jgi:RHS repeat-associated protein